MKKCQVLLDFDSKADPGENIDLIIQPISALSRDLINGVLEKNKVTLPFKSSKLKLW